METPELVIFRKLTDLVIPTIILLLVVLKVGAEAVFQSVSPAARLPASTK